MKFMIFLTHHISKIVFHEKKKLKRDSQIFLSLQSHNNVFDIHIRTKDKVVVMDSCSTFMVHKNRVRRLD